MRISLGTSKAGRQLNQGGPVESPPGRGTPEPPSVWQKHGGMARRTLAFGHAAFAHCPQGTGVAVDIGVGLTVGQAALQLCAVCWHDCNALCSVWLQGRTQPCAACSAVLHALARGLAMHVCRAVVINESHWPKQLCASIAASPRQVCCVERQPATHCGSGTLGAELAHAATHPLLSVWQVLASVLSVSRHGCRQVRSMLRAFWQSVDVWSAAQAACAVCRSLPHFASAQVCASVRALCKQSWLTCPQMRRHSGSGFTRSPPK
jgi:hypothetical protein